jgi:membrane protein DedA with SNARE-associated domain
MTELLIQYLEMAAAVAATWGFVLVFLFMTIESSFIPFPSEIVMIPAGFLAARAAMPLGDPMADVLMAVFIGTAGSLAGAYINYFLFSWLGSQFLEKYGKYFGLPPAKLRRAEAIFREYGAGATFVCRLLPAIRQLISIPAGISRMPLGIFSFCTALGAGIWVAVLAWIGYYLGKTTSNMSYADLIHRGKDMIAANMLWIIISCVVFFVAYVWLHNKIMGHKAGLADAATPGLSEE